MSMITVRDALRGNSNAACCITDAICYSVDLLQSFGAKFLVSSRKIMRRFLKITWKFATISLFYGMIVHLSILEAKLMLCRFCQQYMNKIKAPHFWILLGILAIGFVFLNLKIVKYLKSHIKGSIKQRAKKTKMGPSIFCRYPVSKTTRSGRIYGYM